MPGVVLPLCCGVNSSVVGGFTMIQTLLVAYVRYRQYPAAVVCML